MPAATAQITDAEVLAAARGDRDAFGRLIAATKSLVSSIALAETRDLDASRDVAQDVYLQVWNDLRKLRRPSSFLPFLRQVTRQRARRLSARLRRAVAGDEGERALAAAEEPRCDPGEALLDNEQTRLLREALDALPDEAREMVALYYREGQSAAQVASLLGVSEAAVHQRLSRTRARLREDLLRKTGAVLEVTVPGAAFVAGVVALLPLREAAAAALGAASGARLPVLLSSLAKGKGALAAVALVALLVFFSGWRPGPGGGGPAGGLPAAPGQAQRERDGEPTDGQHDKSMTPGARAGARLAPATQPLEVKPGAGDGYVELRVSSAGKPAATATVQLYFLGQAPVGEPAREGWRLASSGATGADGRVRLPAGPGTYLASARLSGFAPAHLELVRAPGEAVTRGALELRPGEALSGAVKVRGSTEPVPLARVILWPRPGSLGVSVRAPAEEQQVLVADVHGAFHGEGLAPGEWRLEASAPGYSAALVPSVHLPRSSPLVVELSASAFVSGTVVTKEGAPAGGAEVLAFGGAFAPVKVAASESGTFSLEVGPGQVRLSATKGRDAGALASPVSLRPGESRGGLVLALLPAAAIAGTVVDDRGAPLAGATVAVSPRDPPDRGYASPAPPPRARVETSKDGSYAAEGLAAGEWDVAVDAPGFEPTRLSGIAVLEGQRFPLQVRLRGTGQLEGRVVDARGAPVEGAVVETNAEGPWRPGSQLKASTGADGSYRIIGLLLGQTRVNARREGSGLGAFGRVEIPAGAAASLELRLPDEGEISGRVLRPGGRLPDRVFIHCAAFGGPLSQQGASGDAAADGSFRFSLPPGQYKCNAFDAAFQHTRGFPPGAEATVTAGQTLIKNLVFQEDGNDEQMELVVTMREPNGSPAAFARWFGMLPSGRDALGGTADETGRQHCVFSKGSAVVGGDINAVALLGGRLGRALLTPGQTALEIQLLPAARVEGKVTGGTPGTRFRVEATPLEPLAPKGVWDDRPIGGTGERQFLGQRFVLDEVVAVPLLLTVTAEDGRVAKTVVRPSPGESVRAELSLP